jgi:predicted Zn-dependent protease
MKYKAYSKKLALACIAGVFVFIQSCSTVPVTGRKQVSLLPESQMVSMSLTNYNEFLKSSTLSKDATKTAMVKRAGLNISTAVEKFLKDNGKEKLLKNYAWEFNLVEDNTPNAWCMPGGKVVVYTGILPYTKTEAGLAVVMGHEVAHAVAKHGNERMSQGLVVQFGGMALDAALKEKPEQTRALFMQAYGVGSQVGVLLPYSRLHESEADKLGLIFMAMAGYDPNEAVAFWERMAKAGGQKPPEIISTHPSDESRIQALKDFMPEALKYYKKK